MISVIRVILSQMRTVGAEKLSNLFGVTQKVCGITVFQTEDSDCKAYTPTTTHRCTSPLPKNDPANPPNPERFDYYHF